MWKDCETELDFLDFDYIIKILQDTINDSSLLPSSIGIYGDWGSGKSSLMNMCKKEIEKVQGTVCLMFNGWLFEGYEDAKTAILGSILDKLEENTNLTTKAKVTLESLYESIDKFKLIKGGMKIATDFLLTGGIGTIADLTIESCISQVKEISPTLNAKDIRKKVKDKLSNKELRENIKSFREKFQKLLDEMKIKKLVVFIDELDRCNPNTILDTLEAIRLFLFVGNVSFVIGADERHIIYAVKSKFKDIEGIQFDIGKEYLEKLIQYPIRIPRLNVLETEFYIMCLLFESKLKDEFDDLLTYLKEEKKKNFLEFKVSYSIVESYKSEIAEKLKDEIIIGNQLADVLAKGLNGNPRQCKRFLNTLDMRLKMAKYKGVELNIQVLAKIMELEYFRISLFKKMAQLCNEDTLKSELDLFEKGEIEKLNMLSSWKDDSWVKKWMESEPLLSNEDLSMYFYFTRTSLDNKGFVKEMKMSESAQKYYEGLLKNSAVILNLMKKNITDLSDFDLESIQEGLFNNLVKDDELRNDNLKTFLEVGKLTKELQTSAIEYLKGINGTKLKRGKVPLLQGFYCDIDKKEEFKGLLIKWKEENSDIKKEIDKILGDE